MANNIPTADVVIVGSGLAGMTAAVLLSEAGYSVHVVEANDFLGGRTASWNERGMEIESGFHRFLGFYTALPRILKKVGIKLDDILFWEDEVEIRLPYGQHEVFGLAPVHKPLKTAASIFGHTSFISPTEKLAIGKMLGAAAKDYLAHPEKLDQIPVATYARNHGVSERTIDRLLTPATEGVFFVPPHEYSTYNLMGLVMPYLKSIAKLRVGAFKGGMSKVLIQPMADFVLQHGGSISISSPVEKLLVMDGEVRGVQIPHGKLYAKQTLLAASLHGAQHIIKQSFTDTSPFANLLRLPTMPAVTFQIELTKPSMKLDRTTFGPGTVLTSFAEQSRTTFRSSAGRLSIILSPPERFIAMPDKEVLDIVMKDARRLGIELEGKVKDYRKVVLKHDFYSLRTGNEALRPAQEAPLAGLTLAGDYTKQPYLATMEGAVVSGRQAAKVVKKHLK